MTLCRKKMNLCLIDLELLQICVGGLRPFFQPFITKHIRIYWNFHLKEPELAEWLHFSSPLLVLSVFHLRLLPFLFDHLGRFRLCEYDEYWTEEKDISRYGIVLSGNCKKDYWTIVRWIFNFCANWIGFGNWPFKE